MARSGRTSIVKSGTTLGLEKEDGPLDGRILDPGPKPPSEVAFRAELETLRETDSHPKPPGWKLSPIAVRAFILGDPERGIRKKFVGHPSLVDRAMVALALNLGLMLVGEPGAQEPRTTKSSTPGTTPFC